MLAGEEFSDHPHSVSPVIAALARAYNDRARGTLRQRLTVLATEAVRTRADGDIERLRAAALRRWLSERDDRRPAWRRVLGGAYESMGTHRLEELARGAMQCLPREADARHREFMALIRSLIRIGERDSGAVSAAAGRLTHTRSAGGEPVLSGAPA